MAERDILKEWILSLQTEGPSSSQLRDAERGIAKLVESIEGILPAIAAASTALVAGTVAIADSLTKVYYSAQRIGTTAQKVTALGDAAELLGGNVQEIQGDFERLSKKMRESYSFKDYVAKQLKLTPEDIAKDSEGFLIAAGKAMAELRKNAPQRYAAIRDAGGLDFSERTVIALGSPEWDKVYAERMAVAKGIDEAAKKSVELHNAVAKGWQDLKNMSAEAAGPLMTALTGVIEKFDAWMLEKKPELLAFSNLMTDRVNAVVDSISGINFGDIGSKIFASIKSGLASVHFNVLKEGLTKFLHWLTTGPLANAVMGLLARIGGAIGATGSYLGEKLGIGAPDSPGRRSQGSPGAGRAGNQGAESADKTPSGDTPPPPAGAADGSPADFAESLSNLHDHDPSGHAKIMQFLRDGGHGMDPATTDWCASFVSSALHHAGYKDIPQVKGGDVANAYQNWGDPVAAKDVQRGDVVITTRGKRAGQTGGHVSIATGPMVNGKIPVIEGDTRAADWSPGHPRHQVARDWERDRSGLMYRRGRKPEPEAPQGMLLRDAHNKLAALLSHPASRQMRENIAMLSNYRPPPAGGQWSRHDGVRNQNIKIEIASTDAHSAASEVARQMAHLQKHTLQNWDVA